MEAYFSVSDLSVGYEGEILIRDIGFQIGKGTILTLIGPNGAGKSTILKTITRHLDAICGSVCIESKEIAEWSPKELAQQISVVLTERIRPELVTCAEVVAMGRYPYTNLFGKLTQQDIAAVEDALRRVHAIELAQRDFSTLSDGQRQRVLLARAICQEPHVLVLDEPTAYLDIRHKIELLDILREMAREKQITVIMSLHEIDLAAKVSDYLMCVKGETITAFGSPEEILSDLSVEELYDIEKGSYNALFGSVELTKPSGKPELFVVAGGGYGVMYYRALQKKRIPFATGVLFENDIDFQVARALSDHVVSSPAFDRITEQKYTSAAALLSDCQGVIDAGTPTGEFNETNRRLLSLAAKQRIPILTQLP